MKTVSGSRLQSIPIPAHRASSGGPPGSSADHQTAKYIVGNEPAGDTLAVCDFLDPGNGTGIEAALAAATALGTGCDIYLRPGTYDTTAVGAPTLPMELPPATIGATFGPTTTIRTVPSARFQSAAGAFAEPSGARIVVGDQRHILTPTGAASILYCEGVFFDVLASSASTGSVMVGSVPGPGSLLLGTFNRCQVRLPQGTEATETLSYIFSTVAGGQFTSCDILGEYKNGEAGGTFLTAIYAATDVTDCTVAGVDYCISSAQSGRLAAANNVLSGSTCIFSDAVLIASGNYMAWTGPTCLQIEGSGSSVVGNNFLGPGSNGTAVLVAAGACTVSGNHMAGYAVGIQLSSGCSVSGNTLESSGATTGILVDGDNNVISGNVVYGGHTVGINVSATANRTLIVSNNVTLAVTPIVDAGTGTITGFNIT